MGGGKKEAAFTVNGKSGSKSLRVSEALSWDDLKVDIQRDFPECTGQPYLAYGSGGQERDVVSDASTYRDMFTYTLGEMAAGSPSVSLRLVTKEEAHAIRDMFDKDDVPPSPAAVRRESSRLSTTSGLSRSISGMGKAAPSTPAGSEVSYAPAHQHLLSLGSWGLPVGFCLLAHNQSGCLFFFRHVHLGRAKPDQECIVAWNMDP